MQGRSRFQSAGHHDVGRGRHGASRGPAAVCPAAIAVAVLVPAGLLAAYGRPTAGLAALGVGGVALVGRSAWSPGRSRARIAWGVLVLALGLRIVLAVGSARDDARAWRRAASSGASWPGAYGVEVESSRELPGGRWSARGRVVRGRRPAVGAILSWRGDEPPRPAPGERWELRGRLAPEPPRARVGARFPPGGLGPGGRRGVLEESRAIVRSGARPPLLATAERHLRDRIRFRFGSLAPMATALLLGDRRGLDPALVDAFAVSGALHLLAVSGLHVGFLAAIVLCGLRLCGARRSTRTLSATAMLVGYAALVGGRVSVLRATVMTVAFLAAGAGERKVSPWQAWGVAAVALLAWDPLRLLELGFALSFAAVAGLMAVAGPWERWITRSGGSPKRTRIVRLIAGGLAATSAATVATLPIQAAAFGWVAPAGFLVNPAAVPLAGAGLPLTWAALAVDAISLEVVAGPVAHVASMALGTLRALVIAAATRPVVWVPGPVGWGVVGIVALAVAWTTVRRRPAQAFLLAACGAGVILAVGGGRDPERLEVAWLDVGQGDAIVLRLPGGETWLVDAGPADPYGDAGRRVVVPFLRLHGVSGLGMLVTTHADLDHVGGAASVVRSLPVRRWGSAGPIAGGDAWLGLLAATGPGGGPPRADRLLAGRRLRLGGVSVDVLHPDAAWIGADPYTARISGNEASVVLLVTDGACRLLLTGDLGRRGERHLVETLGDSLRAGLLHVGHHGSRHSSTAAFLERVAPRHAVVSVGSRNRFGHPHPDALARLRAAGATVHRTDRSGTVIARCTRRGWRIGGTSP